MIARTTQITLMREDGQIFDEDNFTITIDDESGGEFVVVRDLCDDPHEIRICPTEWPELREAINQMVINCKEND